MPEGKTDFNPFLYELKGQNLRVNSGEYTEIDYLKTLVEKNQARLTEVEKLEQKLTALRFSSISDEMRKELRGIRFRAEDLFFYFCKKQENLEKEYVNQLSNEEKNILANSFFIRVRPVSEWLPSILIDSLLALLIVFLGVFVSNIFLRKIFKLIWYRRYMKKIRKYGIELFELSFSEELEKIESNIDFINLKKP